MTVPTNETGESIHSQWLAPLEKRYEERLVARPRFEQRFCGVVVSLIVAVAMLVCLVAIAVSGPQ
jgi:hypothetical protein